MARIGIIAAAAIALAAASSTTPANAGGSQLGAARLGGFVAGAIIPHTANSHVYGHNNGHDVVCQQKRWNEKQFVGSGYFYILSSLRPLRDLKPQRTPLNRNEKKVLKPTSTG